MSKINGFDKRALKKAYGNALFNVIYLLQVKVKESYSKGKSYSHITAFREDQ